MIEAVTRMPTDRVCKLCDTYLTDRCEGCLDNNLIDFTPRKNITIDDLVPFPKLETMYLYPAHIRLALVTIALDKLIEQMR